jgi:hypothetical protein
MTECPLNENSLSRLDSVTPDTWHTYGIILFTFSCIVFWISIAIMLYSHFNFIHIDGNFPLFILIFLSFLGVFSSINILANPEWRFIIIFVVPISIFSSLALCFLFYGYPETWRYPIISYFIAFYSIGLFLLILSSFVMIYNQRGHPGLEKIQNYDLINRAAPLPVKHILTSDLDNPVRFAADGTATLIGMIEDLKMELERSNKKSVSEQKKILLNILEIADSIDSIIGTLDLRISEGEIHLKKVTENFRSLRRKVDQILRNSNVHTIITPDGIANLGTHEIFETRFRPDLVDYTIIEEIKKGYIWNGQILREALVIVAMKHSAEQLRMR